MSTTVKASLYSQALTILRKNHQEEFHEIVDDLYVKAGLVYRRRLTKEEREAAAAQARREAAIEKIRAILRDEPGAADALPGLLLSAHDEE